MTRAPESIDRAYAIIGAQPGSSMAELKRRYKTLARRWHPDRWTNDPASQAEASQRMREINRAFVLLHDALRASREHFTARAAGVEDGLETSHVPPPGRRPSDEEIDAIVRAIGVTNPVGAAGGWLLWILPLVFAFIVMNGHGDSPTFWIPPTRGEKTSAAALALFSLSVLVRQAWIRHRRP